MAADWACQHATSREATLAAADFFLPVLSLKQQTKTSHWRITSLGLEGGSSVLKTAGTAQRTSGPYPSTEAMPARAAVSSSVLLRRHPCWPWFKWQLPRAMLPPSSEG